MRAEVIAIGDELTTGQRLDTNSQWLSAELGLLGIPVHFHTTVCDTVEDGVEAFRIAVDRADVVVATGGLGPTADDLTRDVIAAVAGVDLELSPTALRAVESRFARRGVAMPESNRRQAVFPRGTRIIPNPDGTAPGIDLDIRRADGRTSRVIALPGVPAEMRTMWHGTVAPALAAVLPEAGVFVHRRIKCFGAGESAVEALLPDMIRRGRDPLVGITAHEATITLRIVARGLDEAECRAKIAPTERTIRECLGGLVYGVEDDEVEDAALRAIAAAGESLATLEIATQGRLAAGLARAAARWQAEPVQPGAAPGGFVGGGVETAGVSAAVELLAERVRAERGASLGLAIGPVRPGPEGRSVVDIALVGGGRVERIEHMLGGGPEIAVSRAAKTAVDLVRRRLAGRNDTP
ncbi:MAG: putative competence-damage inducible protein [Planctomycetota bacterium]|jgi:nicotinamide-nucleotide amidase